MKNKKLYQYIYRMMMAAWILSMMFALTGCGKEESSVQTTEAAKKTAYQVVSEIGGNYVCAMYRLENEETDSVIGKLQSLDDENKVFTAAYTDELGAFSFWVEEGGRYQVSIVRGDTVLSEHIVDINEENDYYLLYMKGMR